MQDGNTGIGSFFGGTVGKLLNGATINNTYAFKMAAIQNTLFAISSLLFLISVFISA